jgi:tRNA 5-methylaminomethyl-2-thiouridine biosynthesis bifunctional protein
MAARGWQVTVLAQGSQPADGASGLPAGVTAPHVSPDDRPISRLTRAGVAATFARARALLREGIDFAECGVLERHASGKRQTPPSWQTDDDDAINNAATRPLSAPASAQQCQQAGAAADDGHAALWHARAGWLRPAALVRAMLPRRACASSAMRKPRASPRTRAAGRRWMRQVARWLKAI